MGIIDELESANDTQAICRIAEMAKKGVEIPAEDVQRLIVIALVEKIRRIAAEERCDGSDWGEWSEWSDC